jgi:hypothetical protein
MVLHSSDGHVDDPTNWLCRIWLQHSPNNRRFLFPACMLWGHAFLSINFVDSRRPLWCDCNVKSGADGRIRHRPTGPAGGGPGDLVRGAGRYVDDVTLPGQVLARCARRIPMWASAT